MSSRVVTLHSPATLTGVVGETFRRCTLHPVNRGEQDGNGELQSYLCTRFSRKATWCRVHGSIRVLTRVTFTTHRPYVLLSSQDCYGTPTNSTPRWVRTNRVSGPRTSDGVSPGTRGWTTLLPVSLSNHKEGYGGTETPLHRHRGTSSDVVVSEAGDRKSDPEPGVGCGGGTTEDWTVCRILREILSLLGSSVYRKRDAWTTRLRAETQTGPGRG